MQIDAKLHRSARRWRYVVRGFGWFFFIFGLGFSLFAFISFADPNSTITVNGVPTKDPRQKLAFALFPLIHASIGSLLAFCPARFIDAFFFWQEQTKRKFWRMIRGKK
jgi:hypothetical protein